MIDRVRFENSPTLIVWDGEAEPQMGQRAIMRTQAPVSAPRVIKTGYLLNAAVHDDQHVATGTSKTFRVASNAPYNIAVEATLSDRDTDVPFEFGPTDIGQNAQLNRSDLAQLRSYRLGELTTPVILFQSGMRTARSSGSIRSQSIEFTADWRGARSADVLLTVYIP